MRVGILTYTEGNNNAGALLQALALQKTVAGMGHRAELIRFPAYRDLRLWRRLWQRMRTQGNRRDILMGYLKYLVFRRRNLVRSRACHSLAELRRLAQTYAAIVVGSDQVWNTRMAYWAFLKRPDTAFLSFTKGLPVRRIAYAACSGTAVSDSAAYCYAPYWLRQFAAISVRNRATQSLVGEWLEGNPPVITCDPSLLYDFSEFKTLRLKNLPARYVLVYAFPSPLEEAARAVLERMRAETNLPVVVIPPADHYDNRFPGGDHYAYALDPGEWVSLIANADAFLTNSFHGMLFAANMGTPFVAYYQPGSAISGRLEDAAGRYALQPHVMTSADEASSVRWRANEDERRRTRERMDRHVEESRGFLRRSFEKPPA